MMVKKQAFIALGALAGLLLMLVLPGFAEEKASEDSAVTSQEDLEQTEADTSGTGISASKVAIDKDGAIRRPKRSEEAALSRKLKKTLNRYKLRNPEIKADGSISVIVAPHFMGFAVARVAPDGTVTYDCADGAEGVERLLDTANQTNPDELPER